MVRSDTESCISPLGNEREELPRGCDGGVVQCFLQSLCSVAFRPVCTVRTCVLVV